MDPVRRIVEMNKRLIIGLVALALALALSASSQGARATAEPQITVTGQEVSVSGIRHKGTILEDVKMHHGTHQQQCKWVNGGYNSGRSVNGGLKWFYDPVRAKICRNSNSPTGWVKVAGGQTGRNCGNPYKPKGPAPGPVVNGPVIMVRDFSRVHMTAIAKASVNLSAEMVCPDGAILRAQSRGEASSRINITTQILMSVEGDTNRLEAQLKENISAKAKAQAEGKINMSCAAAPVKPEEPPEEPEKPVVPEPPVIPEYPKHPEPPAPPKKEHITIVKPVKKEVVYTTKPAELPNTGPGAAVAAFIGVSSLASFAYSAISRRFGA